MRVPSLDEIIEKIVGDKFGSAELDDRAQAVGEDIRTYVEPYYNDAVTALKSLNGAPCWRSMKVPMLTTPLDLPNLGVFWSSKKSSAYPVWGDPPKRGDVELLMEARVDLASVNVMETLANNVLYPDEDEVQFKLGSRIFLVQFQYKSLNPKYAGKELSGVIAANVWKRC